MIDATMKVGRRRLFGFLAAAPLAARAAAKAAVNGGGGGYLPPAHPEPASGAMAAAGEAGSWWREQMVEIASGKALANHRASFRERNRYDRDLASMRSVSLAAAETIQEERTVARDMKRYRSWIEEGLAKATRGLMS